MTTLKRLAALEARAKPLTKPGDLVAETRAMLDREAGADQTPQRGENLLSELVRRSQVVNGCDLSGIPGDTLVKQEANSEHVAAGKMEATLEAKHAARQCLELWNI